MACTSSLAVRNRRVISDRFSLNAAFGCMGLLALLAYSNRVQPPGWRRALLDTGVYGVKTTIPYHLEVLKTAEFQAAEFDTGFVEDHPQLVNYKTSRPARELAAVAAAAVAAYAGY